LVTVGNPWVAYDTFPKLAEAYESDDDIGPLIRTARKRLLLRLGPLALVLVLAGPLLMVTFYSQEFAVAAYLLPLTVTFALLQVGSQVGQGVLKARHDIRSQLWTQLAPALLLLLMVLAAATWAPRSWGMAVALVGYGVALFLSVEFCLWRSATPSLLNARRWSTSQLPPRGTDQGNPV